METSKTDTTSSIEELEVQQPYVIDRTALSNKKTKQFDLLDNDDVPKQYILKNRWYEFNFEEVVFCKSITFRSNNKEISGLKVVAITPMGKEIEVKIKNKESGNIIVTFNRVVKGFKIKPTLRILDKISLSSIEITGYLESEFTGIEEHVGEYVEINANLNKKLKQLEDEKEKTDTHLEESNLKIQKLESTISLLSSEEKELMESVAKSRVKLEDLTSQFDEKSEDLAKEDKSLVAATNNLEKLQYDSKTLNEEIRKNENQIAQLINNKNLFAYEIEDYVEQGNRDIQSYLLLAFLPWLLVAYVTYYLFNGAVDLTHVVETLTNVKISDVIISRLPFTAIAGAVIIVSYEISKIFVMKILEINTQKLRLSELGIIAKDVSFASANELGLENEEIFLVRTKLKMDLLRHHLKKLDPESFKYEIDPSIWNKYKKILSGLLTKNETVEKTDKEVA